MGWGAWVIQLLVGLFGTVVEKILGKPYKTTEEYEDVGRKDDKKPRDDDDPFVPSDF
jgi:hypothetical protein